MIPKLTVKLCNDMLSFNLNAVASMTSGIQNGYKISKVLLTVILLSGWHPISSFPLSDVLVRQAVRSPIFNLVLSSHSDIAQGHPSWASTITITSPSPIHDINEVEEQPIDNRPHEQRTKGPRQARRLNHAFRYLYRNASHFYRNMTAFEFFSRYYTGFEILAMNETFPPLLDLNVSRHLHPKVRFLQETLHMDRNDADAMRSSNIPPQYFGSRLEKTIAPRHAFLVYKNLPHGKALLRSDSDTSINGNNESPPASRFTEFLLSSRKTNRFCALCNQWRKEQQHQQQGGHESIPTGTITSKQIEAFDCLFGRGVLAAARDDLVQWNNTWPLDHINISSSEILRLMIQHGANPLERDIRGTTLLHWAAGTGNLAAVQELLPYFPNGMLETTERDGATPLHWAAAGANPKEFGTGGHAHVCQYLLSQCDSVWSHSSAAVASNNTCTAKELVNRRTYDGNSPLMWAAWSGSLDTVKLMVRHRADWDVSNRNGCTVAHWAASGGNLDVCKYLAEVVNVDFFKPNQGGNTPLTHAVAFGRTEVVKYIRQVAESMESGADDEIAARLAADFVGWDRTDVRRNQVFQLFQNDDWDLSTDEASAENLEEVDMISIEEAQRIELEEY